MKKQTLMILNVLAFLRITATSPTSRKKLGMCTTGLMILAKPIESQNRLPLGAATPTMEILDLYATTHNILF